MTRSPLPPIDTQQRYTINEACQYLRISRPFLYEKVKRREIRILKDRSRSFIPGSEIVRNSTLAA